MSAWFRRAVGSVGVACTVGLLGAGSAPAGAALPLSETSMGGSRVSDPIPRVPDGLRPAIDGANMIGDDFVDQASYAGALPLATLDSLPGLDGAPLTDATTTAVTASDGRPRPAVPELNR